MSFISLIIKPTDLCNLNCQYCYHKHSDNSINTMSPENLEKILTLCANEYKTVNIIWHGGEPLMAGLDFFKNAMKIERKLMREKNCLFINSIQTNGTLIDRKWISFFKRNAFHVGVSYDGPKNRQFREETEKVEVIIKKLKRKRLYFGILSVVTSDNCQLVEIYNSVKPVSYSLKFNPFLNPGNKGLDLFLDIHKYITNLKELWDLWAFDTKGIPVEPLISYASKVLGVSGTSMCTMNSCLGKYLDIDACGTIRFCGQLKDSFFVIGNIEKITSISELFESDTFNNILKSAIERRNKCLNSCSWFKLCQGNCICRAFAENSLLQPGNESCTVTKSMLSYIQQSISSIMTNGTPLDDLNPVLKSLIINSLTITNGVISTIDNKNL